MDEPKEPDAERVAAMAVAAAAQVVADRALAVEEAVRDGVVRDSRNTKRTNKFLIILVSLIALSSVVTQYRAFYITGPAIEDTNKEVTGPLSDANQKLDELVDFVHALEKARQDPANEGVSDAELRNVFGAVYDIRAVICSIDDPERRAACDALGLHVDHPPSP